jgi:hypothetical protein
MRIVAKAASVGDLAERLARAEQRTAVEKMGGMIQPMRIDQFAAGRIALGEKPLHVAQRDARFGGYLDRSEIRIGKANLDRATDARE